MAAPTPCRCRPGARWRRWGSGMVGAEAQPIADILISDGRPGQGAAPLFLHSDSDEIDEGPMGHILRTVPAARPARCDRDGGAGELPPGTKVVGQSEAPASSVSSCGRISASCAGAGGRDGRGSEVATRAGIGRMAGTMRRATGPRYRPRKAAWWRRARVLHAGGAAGDPALAGNRSSIVWTDSRARARRSRRWTRRAISRSRARASGFSRPHCAGRDVVQLSARALGDR